MRHPASFAAAAWLSSVTALGCVGGGDTEPPVLRPGTVLTVHGEQQLATAEVDPLSEGPFIQGPQTFFVRLTPSEMAANATLVDLTTFMPAHGHGTGPPTIVDATGGYRIEELNLFMPGRWELTLHLQVDGSDDSATFSVDVR